MIIPKTDKTNITGRMIATVCGEMDVSDKKRIDVIAMGIIAKRKYGRLTMLLNENFFILQLPL